MFARRLPVLVLAVSGAIGVAEIPLPQVERLESSPVLRHLKPNPLAAPARTAPEQTVASMFVPEGFRAVLVAAEPDVLQPVALAIDERGRLWVAEAHSYPTRRPAGEGLDRIVIFADADGDGRFESRKVFVEGLNLVSGFEVGYGGVWVGAAPELLFIPDRDGNDVPDGPPTILLDGFGYQDTHECLNSFLWGPDGWLYGIQGVFNLAHIGKPGAPDAERQELRAGVWRYHPVRHAFEIFAHGGSNPWGLDFDSRGQLFMTHCRSYWGRGGTTHVIQGGHFWNQANANYAPFVVAEPPEGFPGFRNFLLASARYDHGAGGAGAPGTDAIYGGHSHVGTMIYQGDNWPEEFRGRLFTHNLHGHQINQQVNRPWGSGFDTVHAGRDQFFCSDPAYVAIDLQYGPDGAVYMIDWYDQQHCHNPNSERWDRGNGRIYRLQWDATYRPKSVNLRRLGVTELVSLLGHPNEWYARTARRLLHEQSVAGPLPDEAISTLASMAATRVDPAARLRALWSLHAVGRLDDAAIERALRDPDEYVRGWAIQLAADDGDVSASLVADFLRLARTDPSQVVRRFLASAIHRLSPQVGWDLVERLSTHGEDGEDRNIPALLWQAAAPLVATHLDAAFGLASTTPLPRLADWIHWYAATLEGAALDRAVRALGSTAPSDLPRRLAGLWLAMAPRANVPMPDSWKSVAPALYESRNATNRRLAERLAAAFGDQSLFPKLRGTLADASTSADARRHAFEVLARAQDAESLPLFVRLLDDTSLRGQVLPVLSRFDHPSVSDALLERFGSLPIESRGAILNTLTSRPSYAMALLKAVADGRVPRDQVTAFHVRQLANLENAEVDRLVTATWGRIQQTPAEKQALISKMEKTFDEAPLWAYDGNQAGREHYKKLCASCHVLGQDGVRVGPELTGAGRNGIRYYLENILDPNAVIGSDFQATLIETKAGDTVTGMILQETASALTLKTPTDQRVIAKSDIVERATSQLSLMPEGLLESIPPREQIELLKYLTSH